MAVPVHRGETRSRPCELPWRSRVGSSRPCDSWPPVPYFVTYEMFELVRVDLAVFCLIEPVADRGRPLAGTWNVAADALSHRVAILSVLCTLGFTILSAEHGV